MKNNLTLKTRCCCFHDHNTECASKKLSILKDTDPNDLFTRTHKKCHLHNYCKC